MKYLELERRQKEFQSHDRPTMGKGNIQSMKWKVKKGKVERKGKKQRSQRHCESGRGERKLKFVGDNVDEA
jgi:hypothetical protein